MSPNAPSGLGTTPASPANDNAPKAYGSAEAGSTASLYIDERLLGRADRDRLGCDVLEPGPRGRGGR